MFWLFDTYDTIYDQVDVSSRSNAKVRPGIEMETCSDKCVALLMPELIDRESDSLLSANPVNPCRMGRLLVTFPIQKVL